MDRPPGTVRSRVASGVAKLRARRAAGRQSGTNNTQAARLETSHIGAERATNNTAELSAS